MDSTWEVSAMPADASTAPAASTPRGPYRSTARPPRNIMSDTSSNATPMEVVASSRTRPIPVSGSSSSSMNTL